MLNYGLSQEYRYFVAFIILPSENIIKTARSKKPKFCLTTSFVIKALRICKYSIIPAWRHRKNNGKLYPEANTRKLVVYEDNAFPTPSQRQSEDVTLGENVEPVGRYFNYPRVMIWLPIGFIYTLLSYSVVRKGICCALSHALL